MPFKFLRSFLAKPSTTPIGEYHGSQALQQLSPSSRSESLFSFCKQYTPLAMLSSTRSRMSALGVHATLSTVRALSVSFPHFKSENRIQANDPTPPTETPNVSRTNETSITSSGASDATLQESADYGERQRRLQAPNRKDVWSRSQQPRDKAMSGPRFEQTIMELQVCL